MSLANSCLSPASIYTSLLHPSKQNLGALPKVSFVHTCVREPFSLCLFNVGTFGFREHKQSCFSCQGLFEALTHHIGKSLLGRFFIIRNCSFPFWVLLHIDVCTVSAEGIFGLCHLVHSKSRVVRWLEQFLEADPTATELALHSLDFWFWFEVFYLPFEPHWAVFLSLFKKAWLSVCLPCIY